MTAERLAKELNIGRGQAEAAVRLLDEGNTVPFIARYRKEATGGLTDEQLRNLYERLGYLRNLDEKKEQVLSFLRCGKPCISAAHSRSPWKHRTPARRL